MSTARRIGLTLSLILAVVAAGWWTFEMRSSVCRACGASLEEFQVFSWMYPQEIEIYTDVALWVEELHPEHREHVWDLSHVRAHGRISCSEAEHTPRELHRLCPRDPSSPAAPQLLSEFLAACDAGDETALAAVRARISAASAPPR